MMAPECMWTLLSIHKVLHRQLGWHPTLQTQKYLHTSCQIAPVASLHLNTRQSIRLTTIELSDSHRCHLCLFRQDRSPDRYLLFLQARRPQPMVGKRDSWLLHRGESGLQSSGFLKGLPLRPDLPPALHSLRAEAEGLNYLYRWYIHIPPG